MKTPVDAGNFAPRPTLRPAPTTPDEPLPADLAKPKAQRVALLVGGHSLLEHWTPEQAARFDCVIAVNGAACLFPCDYAVMVDRPMLERYLDRALRPRVALVTYNAHHRITKRHRVRIITIPTLGKTVKSYTMPRAVVLAGQLVDPAGAVEVFGMDFSEDPRDVSGAKGYHEPKRWEQEAQALRAAWCPQISAVHGRINAERLAFITKARDTWPG